MDAFFASIEQRDDPALQGKPVIIGSPPPRSAVATASREARAYGVHSAQSMAEAKKLCPAGIFVAPRMDVYKRESQQIMDRVAAITLHSPMETKGLDEAYLDVTDICTTQNGECAPDEMAVTLGELLRKIVQMERQLTCSIGVAPNKNLAKLASEDCKPNGIKLIREADKIAYLRPKSVGVLSGIGPKRTILLNQAGFNTVGQIQDYRGSFRQVFGTKIGRDLANKLQQLANGNDDDPVAQKPRQAINRTHTFKRDTQNLDVIKERLLSLGEIVAGEIQQLKVQPLCIHVTVSYAWPDTTTRSQTFGAPILDKQAIYKHSLRLLQSHNLLARPLRMLSIGVNKWAEQKLQGTEPATIAFDPPG